MSGAILGALGFSQAGLSVRVSTTSLFGFRFGSGSVVTNDAVTAIPNGGRVPYDYSWVRTSGSTSITTDNPTSASTRFSTFFSGAGSRAATFVCTVTDGATNTVNTATVTVTLEAY